MATTEIITLKQLCAELKLDPRECHERQRAAVRDTKKFPELAKTYKSPHALVAGERLGRRDRCRPIDLRPHPSIEGGSSEPPFLLT